MLAASSPRIGEIGTATGVGTAWMASAMPESARLVTVELDEARAIAAARVFADDRGSEAGLLLLYNPRLVSVEVVLPDLRNAVLVGTRRAERS